MLSLVFIARILSPMDFGIYGMTLVVFAIPEIFASDSLNDSLIQRPDLRDGHVNSIFIQSLVLAFIFWGGVNLLAPLIAQGFDEPALAPMIRMFSIVLFLGALTSVPSALLQRDLRYREITIVDVIGTISAAVIGVTLAILLKSAWALVFMEISRRVIRLVAFAILARWRPSFQSTWVETRELTQFNSRNVLSKLVLAVDQALPRVFIGGALGPAALGMYNMSVRMLDQARAALVTPFAAVSLPVASQAQNDLPTLHRAMEGAMRLAALVVYPAFIGAAVIAPIAVPFVFGGQWVPAVTVIQISLLSGIRAPTSAFNTGVLNGVGRVDWTLKMFTTGLALSVVFVLATIQFGLEAVALALLVKTFLIWALGAYAVKSVIGFPMHRQVVAGWQALVASFAMGAIVWLCMHQLPVAMEPLVKLAILVPLGALAYIGILAILMPRLALRAVQASTMIVQGRRQEAISLVKSAVYAGSQPPVAASNAATP
ncbi:Membrane protein involved in the export of O-antigen and teichoic acid [Hyphomonas johnsonii MHS-2]|uniref:Membrane protein involved in the export of O-antigen and teichoic acid n=2 Tax=Hyphomonas johnsonii TaxID=81031 RepID=A0A059FVE8_9PROT|nr:Membrane protein involved in the export of O-antigen and teichoic acid [Hyphomonas johnsonii MHS-2]